MPLVRLGDLRGLSPIQQGRKIFNDYDRYGDKIVNFLSKKHPAYSPQTGLFRGLNYIKAERPPASSYSWVRSYEDLVDNGLGSAAVIMRGEIAGYLEALKQKAKKDVVTDVTPEGVLFDSFMYYFVIEESAIQRIESRNTLYKTSRMRLPLKKMEGKDILSAAFGAHSSVRKVARFFPRDRKMKTLLESAELFPAYISGAYLVTV